MIYRIAERFSSMDSVLEKIWVAGMFSREALDKRNSWSSLVQFGINMFGTFGSIICHS